MDNITLKKICICLAAVLIILLSSCSTQVLAPRTSETLVPLGVGTPLYTGEKPTFVPATPSPAPTPKPVNIALGKSVSVDYTQSSEFAAKYLNDGDKTTRWSGFNSSTNFKHWVVIDLETKQSLSSMFIYFESISCSFTVYTSDTSSDDSWTEIYREDISTVGALLNQEYSLDFIGAEGRYIKVETGIDEEAKKEFSGNPYFSIYELEVYGA